MIDKDNGLPCRYTFSVSDVPEAPFYEIEVEGDTAGPFSFSLAELKNASPWSIELGYHEEVGDLVHGKIGE